MPEYRKVKGDRNSLEFFTNPDLAAQVTLEAQRILGVDAAIMFADLLPILCPMGLELSYLPGVGPKFANPIRSPTDVNLLRCAEAEDDCGYIAQTIRNILDDLPSEISLIGFAGAPFTLAAYAIEGQGSVHFHRVRQYIYQNPESWNELLEKITTSVIDYVNLQITAGIDAIQIFDSWVGCLGVREFETMVAPHVRRLFGEIRGDVPKIYFGTGNSHLLKQMYATGPDLLALDWRVSLIQTWETIGCHSIQGNMDPLALCADKPVIEEHALAILRTVDGKPGHVFNLGHGIIPQTPVSNVQHLVEIVHNFR